MKKLHQTISYFLSSLLLIVSVGYFGKVEASCGFNQKNYACCYIPPAFPGAPYSRIGGGCGYSRAGSVASCQAIPGYSSGVRTEWRKSSCGHLNTGTSKPKFSWSYAGKIPGKNCVSLYEASTGNDGSTHTWGDNYLCSTRNYGIRFHMAGPINGMRCTLLHEGASPHTWGDNYLCVPNSSNLQFSWSSAGPISGRRCIKINEPSDPHTWDDNYLCY